MKIAAKDHIHFFKADEIVRFQSGSDGIIVFYRNGHTEIIKSDMDQLIVGVENQGFIRVHPEHIININQIAQIPGSQLNTIKLDNGDLIPVLPNTRDLLIMLLKNHI
jgi:DNA-binding LytR/AlgR family response regulator